MNQPSLLSANFEELIRGQSFRADHFPYDAKQDQFLCPGQKLLTFRGIKRLKTEENEEWLSDRAASLRMLGLPGVFVEN